MLSLSSFPACPTWSFAFCFKVLAATLCNSSELILPTLSLRHISSIFLSIVVLMKGGTAGKVIAFQCGRTIASPFSVPLSVSSDGMVASGSKCNLRLSFWRRLDGCALSYIPPSLHLPLPLLQQELNKPPTALWALTSYSLMPSWRYGFLLQSVAGCLLCSQVIFLPLVTWIQMLESPAVENPSLWQVKLPLGVMKPAGLTERSHTLMDALGETSYGN